MGNDLELQGTVMAIRERVMEYFKGSCVERLTEGHNIEVVSLNNRGRGDYYYIRREAENEAAHMLFLSSLPLLTMKRAPERIILHTAVLKRSPQLRQVRVGLEYFLDKYLQGVKVEINEGEVQYAT